MPTLPRPDLASRRREATQRELAEAALRRIEESGSWSRVRIEDLLSDVGISERTFYRYFDRKHEVLVPLLQDLARRHNALFTQVDGSLEHRAGQALEGAHATMEGGSDRSRAFLRVLFSDPDLRSSWQDACLASESAMAEVLRDVVTPAHRSEAHLVAAMIVLGQRFAIQEWVRGEEPAASLAGLTESWVRRVLRTHDW